jgi:small subunit ribosomal protein S15
VVLQQELTLLISIPYQKLAFIFEYAIIFDMLTKQSKASLIKDFGGSEKNTGSPEVQIALLSEQINQLTAHLQLHKKDIHSRRGLIMMVAQRRKLLGFLKKKNFDSYTAVTKKIGLK